MTLRVLVLAVNRGGKRAHSVAVDHAHLVVELMILVGALLKLFKETMFVNAHAYVSRHSADHFTILCSKLFASSFAAEQDNPDRTPAHDHRHNQINAKRVEQVFASVFEIYEGAALVIFR